MPEPVGRGPLFAGACAGMFAFGIVLALLGTLFGLPDMRARLHVNLAQQGELFLLLYLGVLATSILAGPVIDWLGHKWVLIVSATLTAAALGGFAAADSFASAAAASSLLGLGGGGLNIAGNVLVSDLYGDDRGPMLNLLGIFYGVGALVIPLVAAALSQLLPIPQMLVFAGAIVAVTALAYALLRFPAAGEAHGFSWRSFRLVARYAGIWTLALILFFESGNEAAVGGWVSSYVGAAGASARASTWVLAGYWAALMAGRLMAARLLAVLSKTGVILLAGAGSLTGCVVLLVSHSYAGFIAASIILGFSFAPIYPTTLALAGDRYAFYSGTVFSLLFSVGLAGGMVFPWAIGEVAQTFGLRRGMFLPPFAAAVICWLALSIRSQRPAEKPKMRHGKN